MSFTQSSGRVRPFPGHPPGLLFRTAASTLFPIWLKSRSLAIVITLSVHLLFPQSAARVDIVFLIGIFIRVSTPISTYTCIGEFFFNGSLNPYCIAYQFWFHY